MNSSFRRPESARVSKREGAAMLVVLMVLMTSTALATFAVHSTTMEIRAAGSARQAMQARYVAEGGTQATLAYMEVRGAAAVEYARINTTLPVGYLQYPGAAVSPNVEHPLNVEMGDLAGSDGPPIELDATRGPSLGGRSAYVPDFEAFGMDTYQSTRTAAGRDMSGGSPVKYMIMNLTGRGTLGVADDSSVTGDLRGYHESAVTSRAYIEYGPTP